MHDESAAAQPLAFMVAGAIFIGIVGAVLLSTGELAGDADDARSEQSGLQGDAENLLDILLGSTGITDAENDWMPDQRVAGAPAADPDGVLRLGLLNGTNGLIDFDKLENLRLAPLEDDPDDGPANDGYANYEEVRAAFGLDEAGLDFHIRAKPSLKSVRELLENGERDPNLQVTYLGDVERGGTDPGTGTFSCTAGPVADMLRISMDVTNTGNTATQFNAVFSVQFDTTVREDPVEAATNSFLVQPFDNDPADPSDTTTLYMDLAAYGDCDTITEVTMEVYDPSTRLVTKSLPSADAPHFPAVSQSGATQWMRVDLDRLYYTSSDDITIEYDGDFDTSGADADTVTLQIKNTSDDSFVWFLVDGVLDTSESQEVPSQANKRVFEVGALADGDYEVILTNDDPALQVTDRLLVTSATVEDFDTGAEFQYSEAAKAESTYLAELVDRYCPWPFDLQGDGEWVGTENPSDLASGQWNDRCVAIERPPHNAEKAALPQYGDVFPDKKHDLNEELPLRLAPGGTPSLDIVDVLVVGSNVDHNTMTSASAKQAVRDWVMEAGGTLIVFGSTDQQVQWLQPIFHSGLQSSSGGLSTPDVGHPMLHVADELLYEDFHNDNAWDLQDSGQDDDPADLFTFVVKQGDEAVLAISDPGAYGSGTIILTSWLPADLFGDGSESTSTAEKDQGLFMMNNLLMQGYRDLFLDYGPELPVGAAVPPAWGNAQVLHPELETIALDVTVFVFRG